MLGFYKRLQKRDVRFSFPPFSWGKQLPLIGQAAHGRMAGIIVLTVWPIRGNFVPHENGGKLTLISLFIENTLKSKGRLTFPIFMKLLSGKY